MAEGFNEIDESEISEEENKVKQTPGRYGSQPKLPSAKKTKEKDTKSQSNKD